LNLSKYIVIISDLKFHLVKMLIYCSMIDLKGVCIIIVEIEIIMLKTMTLNDRH